MHNATLTVYSVIESRTLFIFFIFWAGLYSNGTLLIFKSFEWYFIKLTLEISVVSLIKFSSKYFKINSPDSNRVPFEYNPAQKMKKLNRVRDSITEYTVYTI